MKTSEIKKKLHSYIDSAGEKKLKAIYTILESDMEDETYDWTKDEEWLAELDRRQQSVIDGTAKFLTMDEAFAKGRAHIEQKKLKGAL